MAARRPNVLIVLMDQLQRGSLGSYGCRAARTPALDRLAAEGLRLARAYVPLPQCAPRPRIYVHRALSASAPHLSRW